MNGQSGRIWPFGAVENKCLLAAHSCQSFWRGRRATVSELTNAVFVAILQLLGMVFGSLRNLSAPDIAIF